MPDDSPFRRSPASPTPAIASASPSPAIARATARAMVGALSRAMLARDPYTHDHQQRVADLCVAIAIEMRLPRARREGLRLAALIHDIGKIALPAETLTKPTPLAEHETRALRGHVETGLTILGERRWPWAIERTLRQHHERLDGSGYPEGLKGEQISIYGRLAGIADTFSALVSARPYANASAAQDALMSLYQWADTSFHGPLVEQFVQSLGVFPVGTLVELSNEEVAVVLEHNRTRRLEPKVIVLADAAKRPLSQPFMRDLFTQPRAEGVRPLRIHRGLPAGAYGLRPHDFYGEDPALLQPAR